MQYIRGVNKDYNIKNANTLKMRKKILLKMQYIRVVK